MAKELAFSDAKIKSVTESTRCVCIGELSAVGATTLDDAGMLWVDGLTTDAIAPPLAGLVAGCRKLVIKAGLPPPLPVSLIGANDPV